MTGCGLQQTVKQANLKKTQLKGVNLYQNKNIYGFKIAPDGRNILIIINNALVVFDLTKMKPVLQVPEKGLTLSPTNILWSPDSKMATIIFTGDINRMIFFDVANHGQIYDLYAKNLLDLAWADNNTLLYKAGQDSEAIYKISVFSKDPQFVTALKPGEDPTVKMLLINNFPGFILKKDDKFLAVNINDLEHPGTLADLNFRFSEGLLNRSLLLEDKNENGLLLRKYGYLTAKGKTLVTDNNLIFFDTKGNSLTPEGVHGRLLSGGIVVTKEDGSIGIYDLKDGQQRDLPGQWEDYLSKVQVDYWAAKKALLIKEKSQKNGKQINKIMLYQLK